MGVTKRWVPTVGILGAGEMGRAVADKLRSSKYVLSVYDSRPEALEIFEGSGVLISESIAKFATTATVMLTLLPSSETFEKVIEKDLLPELRTGRVVIDLGHSSVGATQRLSKLLALRGAHLLDAPIIGSPKQAAKGTLCIFGGGVEEKFEQVRPLLKILGGLGCVEYCGSSGNGQAMRGAHQMAVGLCSAAVLEALAFAARCGIEPQAAWKALANAPAARIGVESVTGTVLKCGGDEVILEVAALRECLEQEPSLPLTRALLTALHHSPATHIEKGQLVPSLWSAIKK